MKKRVLEKNLAWKNSNEIRTSRWSCLESEALYENDWPTEPSIRKKIITDVAPVFTPFNSDWGLCTNPEVLHYLETISKHFSCDSYAKASGGICHKRAHRTQTGIGAEELRR